jgi:2'-5' RNA ligase
VAWARLQSFGELPADNDGGDRHPGGTEDRCAQSAILVPVPEAEELIGDWRAVHDPKARTGVPAHITLVVPWVPPEQLKPEHFEELEELLADQGPFDYSLDRVGWFGQRVLWLAPTPADPFKRLTAMLASHFDTPPWKGEFAEVVPHLTVGLAGHAVGNTLEEAAEDLPTKLPVRCRAREVDVMCGDGYRWDVRYRVTLRGPLAAGSI